MNLSIFLHKRLLNASNILVASLCNASATYRITLNTILVTILLVFLFSNSFLMKNVCYSRSYFFFVSCYRDFQLHVTKCVCVHNSVVLVANAMGVTCNVGRNQILAHQILTQHILSPCYLTMFSH